MEKRSRNPSVTGHARTGRRYWYFLAAQIVGGLVVTVYLGIVAIWAVLSPSDLLTGVVLSLAGLLSVAAYPSLFKDAIYVNRGNFEWRPRWWRYFGLGFGVTFLVYIGVRTVGHDEALAPVVMLSVLVAVSSFVSAVYLSNRHRFVGTP